MKESSPNFKNGKFQNLSHTPQLSEDYTMFRVIKENLFRRTPNRKPLHLIPSVKTNLIDIPQEENVLIWFGHSSYYLQIDGVRFLVDPVFSGNASPIPNSMKAFKGSDIYTVEELPHIDYLIISHDHYDHLDYKTIVKLKSKIGIVICGLGVGSHFVKWGYESFKIVESDWYDTISLSNNIVLHTLPARHFSGRTLKRNTTLWCSFLLQTLTTTIYLGGDSGYDTHFAEIGNKFDNIDIAILENGQYNNAWRYIHMHPNQVLQAAKDLKTKRLFPVHSGKFALSNHAWFDPLTIISELNQQSNVPLITPMIGEKVYLNDEKQSFDKWWKTIKNDNQLI